MTASGQRRTEEMAKLCHTWQLTTFTPNILVTFFTLSFRHFSPEILRPFLVIVIFSLSPAHYPPCSCPLSCTAPELTSAYVHVPEHRSRKIRGGGAVLRCSEWVSSFLTAHQHILGYLVPYNDVEDTVKDIRFRFRFRFIERCSQMAKNQEQI